MLNDGGTVTVKVQQSKSSYTAIQSAIAHLYKANGVAWSEEFKNRISEYIAGLTRRAE